jgi:hypothetical protein
VYHRASQQGGVTIKLIAYEKNLLHILILTYFHKLTRIDYQLILHN